MWGPTNGEAQSLRLVRLSNNKMYFFIYFIFANLLLEQLK